MYLARGFAVWLLIVLAESVHGTLRQIFLAPAVGDFTARRIAFFTGMLLIFAIAYLLIRWIAAPTISALFAVGGMWAILTLAFEFGIGYFVLDYTRERMLEDYDVSRGGLMGFGIVYMVFVPYLATRVRGQDLHHRPFALERFYLQNEQGPKRRQNNREIRAASA